MDVRDVTGNFLRVVDELTAERPDDILPESDDEAVMVRVLKSPERPGQRTVLRGPGKVIGDQGASRCRRPEFDCARVRRGRVLDVLQIKALFGAPRVRDAHQI